jgi:hypothetical protein
MQKPEVFAKGVVRNILSPSPSLWIYKGNVATIAWIVSTFAPKWAFVSFPASAPRPRPQAGAMLMFMCRIL